MGKTLLSCINGARFMYMYMFMNSWPHAHILVYIPYQILHHLKKSYFWIHTVVLLIFLKVLIILPETRIYMQRLKAKWELLCLLCQNGCSVQSIFNKRCTYSRSLITPETFFIFWGVLIHFIPLLKSMFILSIKYTRGLKYFFYQWFQNLVCFFWLFLLQRNFTDTYNQGSLNIAKKCCKSICLSRFIMK